MKLEEEIVEIKKKLKDHEERITKLEKFLPETKPERARKKISIKEFILQKNPKGDVQRALAIGYYLEKYEGFSSFNAKDLENGFRDTKEKIPQNVPDKIQMNVRNGHMMKVEEKKDGYKAYVLTNSGEKFVENDFKKE